MRGYSVSNDDDMPLTINREPFDRPRTKLVVNKWNDNSRYRSWTKERDRALEHLHTYAQVEAADVMREMLVHVLLTAKAQFHGMHEGHAMSVDWFEQGLRQQFAIAADRLYRILSDLRARSYTLARASESEIIAQLSKRPITATVQSQKLQEIRHRSSASGGHAAHRINLYVDRLRRKITSYAQAAAMSAKDSEEFARDVMVAFPRARRVNVPRRILKPVIRESEKKAKLDIAVDNIDESAWQDMLNAYMNEYVPVTRAPEFVVGKPEVTGSKPWYAWEFENDMTHEFVQSVRDGQVDAANENGITDFVIISVIDNVTCEDCCGDYGCVDFDGQLVSEVDEMTGGDQTVPPYHFRCRCTLAPATDNIPEKPDDGAKDFADWLNT